MAGKPSLFVFAGLDTPLGGPPAFYVTGLMGGFGYNRSLKLPAQDQLFQFPFIKGIDPDGQPARQHRRVVDGRDRRGLAGRRREVQRRSTSSRRARY